MDESRKRWEGVGESYRGPLVDVDVRQWFLDLKSVIGEMQQ